MMATPKHWIPQNPTFERYSSLITGQISLEPGSRARGVTFMAHKEFLGGMINSTIVALSVSIISVFFGSLTAFVFSNLRLKMKQGLFIMFMAIVYLPYLTMLPGVYYLFDSIHLLDTLPGLILLDCAWMIPIAIWLMASYFETVPSEIISAARIDGCSWIGAIFKVVLPISAPGLVAVSVIGFVLAWNEFIGALILTTTKSAKTFLIILSEFNSLHGAEYGLISAGAMLGIIPAIILALIFQRYIIRGMTAGAVKR